MPSPRCTIHVDYTENVSRKKVFTSRKEYIVSQRFRLCSQPTLFGQSIQLAQLVAIFCIGAYQKEMRLLTELE